MLQQIDMDDVDREAQLQAEESILDFELEYGVDLDEAGCGAPPSIEATPYVREVDPPPLAEVLREAGPLPVWRATERWWSQKYRPLYSSRPTFEDVALTSARLCERLLEVEAERGRAVQWVYRDAASWRQPIPAVLLGYRLAELGDYPRAALCYAAVLVSGPSEFGPWPAFLPGPPFDAGPSYVLAAAKLGELFVLGLVRRRECPDLYRLLERLAAWAPAPPAASEKAGPDRDRTEAVLRECAAIAANALECTRRPRPRRAAGTPRAAEVDVDVEAAAVPVHVPPAPEPLKL